MINSRYNIINKIGEKYFKKNVENDEFSYPKALKMQGKKINKKDVTSEKGKIYSFLDMRFANDKISVLVETKDNYDKWDIKEVYNQIQAYVNYEKKLSGNKIVAILANTDDERIKVWIEKDGKIEINDRYIVYTENMIKSFEEYEDIFTNMKNDKLKVVENTYELNELLHKYGINEKLRSQFVGTCLLALKNGLAFEGLSTKQIIGGIEDILTTLLNGDIRKAEKLVILKNKILDSQDIRELKKEELQEVIRNIQENILPYINDKNTIGQDLLNLFFTTFNKYVGKADKNQAFTPDHIVHFMCKIVGVNRNSRVLDPCCGSGAFLVRALTEAMDDCDIKNEREKVKKDQIYGIEYEECAFGLSTTNMLIHGDGNSNIIKGSCFENKEFIEDAKINIVLMNPPYNAQKKHSMKEYAEKWDKKTIYDPSKGFHFVYYIASLVKTGKMAVLLPMQCAIGSDSEIKKFKELMLKEHTLDAVFSLPSDMFHPGANANACCMVFKLGERHEKSVQDTFFGYFKDDGFIKRKNLGRVQKVAHGKGSWEEIEKKWISLYHSRNSVQGLSITKKVNANDEWLAEAYMETDYSKLTDKDFERTIRNFLAYQITYGE